MALRSRKETRKREATDQALPAVARPRFRPIICLLYGGCYRFCKWSGSSELRIGRRGGGRRRVMEETGELAEFLRVQIGDCPEVHAVLGPAHDVVAGVL